MTDEDRDDTPSETTSVAKEDVVVENVGVRKAVRYESVMGSGGVLAADGRQYVVASVRTDRDREPPEFRFTAGDRTWEPGFPGTAGGNDYAVAGRDGGLVGSITGARGDRSFLAFDVPSPLSAAEPRIRIAGRGPHEWPLSTGATERLAAPEPRFELDSLSVPDSVSQGDPLSVSLTATNVSETDGRFLAAVYWPTALLHDDDESHVVERDVAAGQDVTASLDISTEYTAGEPTSVDLTVRGHVSAERAVSVRDT